MPVFEVEVERKLVLRTALYVRAKSRSEAEERVAAHVAENVADSDMDVVEHDEDVTRSRALTAEEAAGATTI